MLFKNTHTDRHRQTQNRTEQNNRHERYGKYIRKPPLKYHSNNPIQIDRGYLLPFLHCFVNCKTKPTLYRVRDSGADWSDKRITLEYSRYHSQVLHRWLVAQPYVSHCPK